MGFTIGVSGAGRFSPGFIALFKAHPLIDDVCVADIRRDRADRAAAEHGLSRAFGSHEELCKSDVDAVAIFSQRHLHGPMTIEALDAGKHVYCAVPISQSIEEIEAIVERVEGSRLIYMTGETSYYYPSTVYCRKRFAAGDFGEFVYGEGQYLHDMVDFYNSFRYSGGSDWTQVAGIPPMYYPTHSTSMVLSVTGARATHVSCLGQVDNHDDGIFRTGANLWDNVFSNESALMRTSDGGALRVNEFRRIGWHGLASVQLSLFGTKSCFEEQANSQVWSNLQNQEVLDLTDTLRVHGRGPDPEGAADAFSRDLAAGFSSVQATERLPAEFEGMPNGHLGSHQFLVDDFVRSVDSGLLPPNHVWNAARYCIPGLVAHESANRGGVQLEIPDLGDPPTDWEVLTPDG